MIEVSSKFFDIKATLECGQVFRYFKNADGSYDVISLDKICHLETVGDKVILTSADEGYFANYFDLSTDYEKITNVLSAFPELSESVSVGKGIRILRQDFYETTISFIISANNNITRIRGIIERLCKKYGTKMNGYFAFPTIEQLQKATVEELKEIGLGYRAPYLYETARTFASIYDEATSSTDAEIVHKILLSQKGIGPKVADCIVLFGLHLTRSYPVDTWIFKASSTAELDTPKKVRDYYLDRYGDYAGIAQQYVFYNAREGAKN